MPGKSFQRKYYYDLLRSISILTVVWIHAWDTFYIPVLSNSGALNWVIFQIGHLPGRYGVPIFVMLTGALMLGRDYPNPKDFITSKLLRFLLCIIFASIVYGLIAEFLLGYSLRNFIGLMLNGNPIAAYHMWYMYMLLGLYASLPFLAKMLKNCSTKDIEVLLVSSVVLCGLPWFLHALKLETTYFISYSFLLQTYAFIAVAGYWVGQRGGLKNISVGWRIVFSILTFSVTILLKYLVDYDEVGTIPADGITWYDSILVSITSVFIFSIFRDIDLTKIEKLKIVNVLSKCSFSIYLWHLLAIHVVFKMLSGRGIPEIILLIFSIVMGLALGILLYFLLRNTKFKIFVS